MDDWFNKRVCDRCNAVLNGVYSMSRFNTDALCEKCLSIEQQHPDYQLAIEIERREMLAGNRNFPGVGWTGIEGRIKNK